MFRTRRGKWLRPPLGRRHRLIGLRGRPRTCCHVRGEGAAAVQHVFSS